MSHLIEPIVSIEGGSSIILPNEKIADMGMKFDKPSSSECTDAAPASEEQEQHTDDGVPPTATVTPDRKSSTSSTASSPTPSSAFASSSTTTTATAPSSPSQSPTHHPSTLTTNNRNAKNDNSNHNHHQNFDSNSSNSPSKRTSLLSQPILVIAPHNTPLGIDINMVTPIISYIQPTSPLVDKLHIGDVLVYVDGMSTAELSHRVVTKLLNGRQSSSSIGPSPSTVTSDGGGGKGMNGTRNDDCEAEDGGENDNKREDDEEQHHHNQHPLQQRKFVFLSRGSGLMSEKQQQQADDEQNQTPAHPHQQQQQQQQQHQYGQHEVVVIEPPPLPPPPPPPSASSSSPSAMSVSSPLWVEEERCSILSNSRDNNQLDNKEDNTHGYGGDGGQWCSPRSVIIKSFDGDGNTPPAAATVSAVSKRRFYDAGPITTLPRPPSLSRPLFNDLPTTPLSLDSSTQHHNSTYQTQDNTFAAAVVAAATTPLPLLTPLQRGSMSGSSDSDINRVLDEITYFSGISSMMDSQTYLTCQSDSGRTACSIVVVDMNDLSAANTTPVVDHEHRYLERRRINRGQSFSREGSSGQESKEEKQSCSSYSSHKRCSSCPGAIGMSGWEQHDQKQVSNTALHGQDVDINNGSDLRSTEQQLHNTISNEEDTGNGNTSTENGGGIDATPLPSSPLEVELDEDVNDINDSNNKTRARSERRRNRPTPPRVDFITIPGVSTNHDINHNIIIDEVSTIYGGIWNSAFQCAGRRLEDTLGYMEEGYAVEYSGNRDAGIVHYDPNTYSQLHRSRMTQITMHRHNSTKKRLQGCAEEDVGESRKNDAGFWNVWKHQRLYVDGALVALVVLGLLSFVAIVVLVKRQ